MRQQHPHPLGRFAVAIALAAVMVATDSPWAAAAATIPSTTFSTQAPENSPQGISPQPAISMPPQAESCKSVDVYLKKFKLCAKAYAKDKKVYVCGSVAGSGYVCMKVIENGCLNINPTKFVLNVQGCVKDYKATSTSVAFTFKVKACFAYVVGQKCTTVWSPKFSVSL